MESEVFYSTFLQQFANDYFLLVKEKHIVPLLIYSNIKCCGKSVNQVSVIIYFTAAISHCSVSLSSVLSLQVNKAK